MQEARTEVAIVGGGLVGLALALALRGGGLDPLVIDRAPARQGSDPRASALADASLRLLRAVGVWRHVGESQPILDIRVSDGDSLLFVHYDHRALGDAPFGAMVENERLQAAQTTAAELAKVRRIVGTVAALSVDEHGANLGLADGGTVHARLVVAADGGRSTLRGLAGIRSRGWRYGQTGIVLTVRHSRPHAGIAHERFFPAGPFAILPLPGNRSSVVWTVSDGMAPALLALDEGRFREELAACFGDFLGPLEPEGPRMSYPLALHRAEQYIAPRLALVGDAAHVLHPIAGQGLNLGLRDAAALAEVVTDAVRLGLDPGGPGVLARYQRWRSFDAVVLLAVTDGLNRLFSTGAAPVRFARDLGLAVVNRLPRLKRVLADHARGTVGRLPRLLTGAPL